MVPDLQLLAELSEQNQLASCNASWRYIMNAMQFYAILISVWLSPPEWQCPTMGEGGKRRQLKITCLSSYFFGDLTMHCLR